MKKIVLFLLILLLILLLCACGKLKAEYMIDNSNDVSIAYSIEVNQPEFQKNSAEFIGYVDDLKSYWIGMGLAVDTSMQGDIYTVTGKRVYHTDSREEAYLKLKELLTGKNSPFESLDIQFSGAYIDNEYKLSGFINLDDIIRRDENEQIPEDQREKMISAAKECSYILHITLPGDVTESNGQETPCAQGLSCRVFDLPYGETSAVQISTHYTDQANKAHYDSLRSQEQAFTYLLYGGAALGVVAVMLAIVITVRRRRTKKLSQ